jgi:hypothetical protein
MAPSMFDQVLDICLSYFQSRTQAELFLQRQCRYHLDCEPRELEPKHLWNLANWVMTSGTLLIGKEKAEELSDKIREFRKSMGPLTN